MLNPTKVHLIKPQVPDLELSARAYEMGNPIEKECYTNSIKAWFLFTGEYSPVDILYCEGYMVTVIGEFRLLIEHGWLAIAGKVVESTIEKPIDHLYYPVISFSMDKAMDLITEQGNRMPLYWMFGGDYVPTQNKDRIGRDIPYDDIYFNAMVSAHVACFGDRFLDMYPHLEVIDER
jgi:hypothetical protein